MRNVVSIIAILALATLGLSGCGKMNQGVARFTGHQDMCIDHVIYMQMPSGVTVKYKADGSGGVVTC